MLHEQALIEAFVIKDRQKRYLNLLATQRGRQKLRQYIAHFSDLRQDLAMPVNDLQTDDQLYNLLKSKANTNTCYVLSEHSNYDSKTLPLKVATEQLFNSGISYFLSCLPGRVVYYEGEGTNQKFLLLK